MQFSPSERLSLRIKIFAFISTSDGAFADIFSGASKVPVTSVDTVGGRVVGFCSSQRPVLLCSRQQDGSIDNFSPEH